MLSDRGSYRLQLTAPWNTPVYLHFLFLDILVFWLFSTIRQDYKWAKMDLRSSFTKLWALFLDASTFCHECTIFRFNEDGHQNTRYWIFNDGIGQAAYRLCFLSNFVNSSNDRPFQGRKKTSFNSLLFNSELFSEQSNWIKIHITVLHARSCSIIRRTKGVVSKFVCRSMKMN